MKNLILFALLVLFAACTKQASPEPQTETFSFSVSSRSDNNGNQVFEFGENVSKQDATRYENDHK